MKKAKSRIVIKNKFTSTSILLLFIFCFSFFINNALGQSNCKLLNQHIANYFESKNQQRYYINKFNLSQLKYLKEQQQWKISSTLNVELPYSKSIESILQPDGNALYTQRNYISPLTTITTSKKIPLTGGEIGISGSLGYFQNLLKNNQQFNANWFNLYINQPLFAYNEFKYSITKQRLELQSDSISIYQERETKLKEFIAQLIDIAISKEKLKTLQKNKSSIKENLSKIKLMYENGKALSVDTILLSNTISQIQLQEIQLQQELKNKEMSVAFYTSKNYNSTLCDIENLPIYQLDKTQLIDYYLRYNHSKELLLDSFIAIENRKRAIQSRGITTTVSAGIGANQTATAINQLFGNPSQRQNVLIGTSIPLTGWSNYKRSKDIAEIEWHLFEQTKNEITFKAEQWVNEQINNYDFMKRSYYLKKNELQSLEQILQIQLEKIIAGKTATTDYNNTLNQMNDIQTSFLEIYKNMLLLRFTIREKTLLDVEMQERVY